MRAISSVAARPGSSALKSSTGATCRKRGVVCLGRTAAREHLPGEACRPSRQHRLDGCGRHRHGADEAVPLDIAALHAQQRQRQGIERPTQARIAGQGPDHGIGPHQSVGNLPHRIARQVQQSVLLEEAAAAWAADGAEPFGVRRQRRRELVGGLLDELRRRRLEHHEDVPLREFVLVGGRALHPGQSRCEQIADICMNREVLDGIDPRSDPERQRQHDGPPGTPHAQIDDANDG